MFDLRNDTIGRMTDSYIIYLHWAICIVDRRIGQQLHWIVNVLIAVTTITAGESRF